MGISGLWAVLGKGEEYKIADYAAAHWNQHRRPLRIAVDEACWRFNNLSDEQVVRIREGEPAANPIEKNILFRIFYFWSLNIQLVFVTDGLRKPGKKRWNKPGGRGGGKADKECIRMLHSLFDRLHVPYHEAPGEAEAECARLQQLGVVDAVWSDDGDCLMFGCTTLIKAYRNAAGKKEWDRIQMYRAEEVLPKFDFDSDSLVMFAVVAGGDYDDKGLAGCGPQKAKKLVQRSLGLARMLRTCESAHEFASWRQKLQTAIQDMDYGISVPPDFPYLKALNGYRKPAVSEDERCLNLRRLHTYDGGWEWWENQMDQTKLRIVLRSHYNLKTREFLKHLAPVFLARALTRNVTPTRREENLSYGVVLRRTQNRKGKNGEDLGQPSEVNIKFDAAKLVQINLFDQPPEEDWSYTVKNYGVPYDPTKPIDGVMLSCFLAHGLPEGALDKAPRIPKKKNRKSEGTDATDRDTPSRHTPPGSQQSASLATTGKDRKSSELESAGVGGSQIEPKASQSKATRKRETWIGMAEGSDQPAKKSRKSKISKRAPSPSPPPATFRRLEIPSLVANNVVAPASKRIPSSGLVIDLDDSDNDIELQRSSPGLSSAPKNTPKTQPTYNSVSDSSASTSTYLRKPARPLQNSFVPPRNAYDMATASQASAAHLKALGSSPVQPRGPQASSVELPDLGVTPSVAILRQQREHGLLSKLARPLNHSVTADEAAKQVAPPSAPSPASVLKPQYEVIDLT